MNIYKLVFWAMLFIIAAVSVGAGDTTYVSNSSAKIDSAVQSIQNSVNDRLKRDSLARLEERLQLRSEMYDKGIDSISSNQSNIKIMLAIIGIMLAIAGYYGITIRKEAKEDLREIKKYKDEIEQCMVEIKQYKEKAKSDVSEISEAKKSIYEMKEFTPEMKKIITEISAKQFEDVGRRAKEENITDFSERMKLISESDTHTAIREYENLIFELKTRNMTKEGVPSGLHRTMGINYYELENYRNALEEFELYLGKFPKDEDVLFYAGYINTQLGDYEKAIKYYHDITDFNNRNYKAFTNWGSVLLRLYDVRNDPILLKEAREKYKRAIAINPISYITYDGLITVLLKMWRHNPTRERLLEAKELAKKVIELNPENKSHYYNLACSESLLEEKNEMLKHLKIAIDYDAEYKEIAREDKDFEKYWDDPDFKALTKE
jgi:tetratricopeptide (TPR) repeat protein